LWNRQKNPSPCPYPVRHQSFALEFAPASPSPYHLLAGCFGDLVAGLALILWCQLGTTNWLAYLTLLRSSFLDRLYGAVSSARTRTIPVPTVGPASAGNLDIVLCETL
jgi:hypothetical protein